MRRILIATVSVVALSLGSAVADDDALVIEEGGAAEATIDASDADVTIDNAFGVGNYDAREILDADIVSLDGRAIAQPIDLLVDSDENIAFVVTYYPGSVDCHLHRHASGLPQWRHTDARV